MFYPFATFLNFGLCNYEMYSKAVGDGPASQAVAGPEFAIFPSNSIACCNKTTKAIF